MSMLHEVRVITNELPEPIEISSARAEFKFTFPTPSQDPRVSRLIAGMPLSFLEMYADLAVRHAVFQEIEPNHWFAEVKGLSGAWGDGVDVNEALAELREAILGWVTLRLESGVEVPEFAGLDLNPGRSREQAS